MLMGVNGEASWNRGSIIDKELVGEKRKRRLTPRAIDLRKTPRIRYAFFLLFAESAIILMLQEGSYSKLSLSFTLKDCKIVRM